MFYPRAYIAAAVGVLALPVVLAAPASETFLRTRQKSEATWEQFRSARTGMLVQLAEPIEDCWSRNSTFLPGYISPMFNSCFDWHSSVHAAYSLYAITSASGDDRYKNIAELHVSDDKVQAEIEYMLKAEAGGTTLLNIETPYGMAWMFNLVMQRKITTGSDALRPIGDIGAESSRKYLASLSISTLREKLRYPAHTNLSWGMIHLVRWARYTKNETLLREVTETFLSVAMEPSMDVDCPVTNDAGTEYREFFPACLLRLAAVVQMWDGTGEELQSWVNERVPSDFRIAPITQVNDPNTGHKFAINFSRAYCLWYIYQATGNTVFRDNYAELITYQISRPDFWNIEAGYLASHFVPQFGVRAIEASKEGESKVFRAD